MPSDASLPPNAPTTLNMTSNGSRPPDSFAIGVQQNNVNGEADVSLHSHNEREHEYHVPPNPTPLHEVCAQIHVRLTAFLNSPSADDIVKRTQEQTRFAIGVIEQALQDYGFETLSLSYNGGKDCLVLLLLYLSVLHTHFTSPHGRRKDESNNSEDEFPTSIPSIYAKPPDPFPAVSSFVATSTSQYHLSLEHISTNPPNSPALHLNSVTGGVAPHSDKPSITFRDAFALYLQQNPQIRAIFVGTRRTDPHGAKLTPFAHTDGNWPPFMRVHPVLDWHLSEIWCFLRHPALQPLEYCHMYDEGYTSLGGVGDTVRNPKLKVVDRQTGDVKGYRPAYEMVEDEEERAGRE